MIRRARQTDFPFIFLILDQIFDEMEMATIASMPKSQFYDLMQAAFLSEEYRYSYRRIWVYEAHGRIKGILAMYPASDQTVIDVAVKPAVTQVGLPEETTIFTQKEALTGEWYLDALAVHPDDWHQGIGSQLLDAASKIARENGYGIISLNVDKTNSKAQDLYEKKGFAKDGEMRIGSHLYNHMIKKTV